MLDLQLGPLGKRLLAAFLTVSLLSIGSMTAAAIFSADQSLLAQQRGSRDDLANRLLGSIKLGQQIAAPIPKDELAAAIELASANDLRFILRNEANRVLFAYGFPAGAWSSNQGNPNPSSERWLVVDWLSGGSKVGTIAIWFPTTIESSPAVLQWSWIAVSALASTLASVVLAWFASSRIARPLLRTANAAQRFAAGDRSARTNSRDAQARWELGDLARAFDATAEDVVDSEIAQQRLSADVAHELRTPLTVLQAGLEEMRDGLVAADEEQLSRLHLQAARLGRLVDDLLLLANSRNRGLTLVVSELNLGELVVEVVRSMQPLSDDADIDIRVSAIPTCMVMADPDRMQQVLVNLLSNPIRYCRPGDVVDVTLVQEAGAAVLRVCDTGPGVTPEELPHLFDRLWRGTRSADSQGSGIGLAVVKELVEAHRGQVVAGLNDGGGLCMTLSLPLQDA